MKGSAVAGGALATAPLLAGCALPFAAAPAGSEGAEPGTGPRLVLLGTAGGPPPDGSRAGIATALVVDGAVYVIDAGRGALSQYKAAGLELRSLKAIFITHLHADHIADYFNFFLLGLDTAAEPRDGISKPVDVFGPGRAGRLRPGRDQLQNPIAPENITPGLLDLTNHQMAGFAYHLNTFMGSGTPDPREIIRVKELQAPVAGADAANVAPSMQPFKVMEDERMRVSATLVPHGTFPSFAYRFDTDHGSLVLSGDTGPSENLVALARGADLLVHEVLNVEAFQRLGIPQAQMERFYQSHTSAADAGKIASQAGVNTLVLNHFAPARPADVPDRDWQQAAQTTFKGKVVVGQDLMNLGVNGGVLRRPPAS